MLHLNPRRRSPSFIPVSCGLDAYCSKPIFLVSLIMASDGSLGAQTNTFPTSGNVGIGTSSPTHTLQVQAGTSQTIATFTPTSAEGIGDFSIGSVGWEFSRPEDSALALARYMYDSAGGAKDNLALSSRSDIAFTVGLSGPQAAPERMRISENGNVGIGTSGPLVCKWHRPSQGGHCEYWLVGLCLR
jgi:hypothetical protein